MPSKEGKCLATIYLIAEEGFDPSPDGVALVLRGEERAERFRHLPVYGSLSSSSVRKLKTTMTALVKNGYVSFYAPPGSLGRYLLLTSLGEKEAKETLSHPIRRKPSRPTAPLFNERN